MNDRETGGPAFPVATSDSAAPVQVGNFTWQFPGLTLRDYFAARAMQALIDGFFREGLCDKLHDFAAKNNQEGEEYLATSAYAHADAMLKVRKS